MDFKPGLGSYRLRVTGTRPGDWLVVSEPWYPGWRASRGGKALAVHRAWGFLLGIPLGQSKDEFVTVTYGLTLLEEAGLWISLSGLLGVIIASGFLRRRDGPWFR